MFFLPKTYQVGLTTSRVPRILGDDLDHDPDLDHNPNNTMTDNDNANANDNVTAQSHAALIPFTRRGHFFPRNWNPHRRFPDSLLWADPDLDPKVYSLDEYTVTAPSPRHAPIPCGHDWVWVRVLDTEDVIDLMWDTGMHTSCGHIVLSMDPKMLWDKDLMRAVTVDTFRGLVPDFYGHRATRMVLWDRANMPVALPAELFRVVTREIARNYYEDLLKSHDPRGYYNQMSWQTRKILEAV
jgi:hypothetical protein